MRLAYVVTAIGLCTAVVAAAVVLSFYSFSAEPVVFSKEAWHRLRPDLESSADPGCTLGPLAQGLMRSGQMNQKSEQYVLEQLGQPSKRQNLDLIYAVGQCHGWGWHPSELVLHLSENRKVVKVEPRKVAPVIPSDLP